MTEISNQTVKSYDFDELIVDIIDRTYCELSVCNVREVWIARTDRTVKALLYSFQADRLWSIGSFKT